MSEGFPFGPPPPPRFDFHWSSIVIVAVLFLIAVVAFYVFTS